MLGHTESLVRIDAHFIVLYDTPQKSFSHLIAIPETMVQGGKKLVAMDCIFICIYFVAVIPSSTGFGDTHVPTNDWFNQNRKLICSLAPHLQALLTGIAATKQAKDKNINNPPACMLCACSRQKNKVEEIL
jgi:hypothetical protein